MGISQIPEGSEFCGIKDAILITSTVYPKTQAAYDALMTELPKLGYKFKDPEDPSYASLQVEHAVECYHCNHVQSQNGVHTHNKPCVACEKPLYIEYTKGETISFYFRRNGEEARDQITMTIFDYDMDTGELLLYPTPVTEERWSFRAAADPMALLRDYQDLYTVRRCMDGEVEKPFIAIPVALSGFLDETSRINTSRLNGDKRYYIPVTLFNGQKYGLFDDLPVPEGVSISKSYIDCKLSLSDPSIHETIMRAAGQVSRVDFYHQDGRPAFSQDVFERMNAFVKHCVDVNYKSWETFIRSSPRDGPGFIRSLASWCSKQSDGVPRHVREEPNMFNAINAALDQQHRQLSPQEIEAAFDGMGELGKAFGTVVRLEDVEPTDFMGTVMTVLDGARLAPHIKPPMDHNDDEPPSSLGAGPQ